MTKVDGIELDGSQEKRYEEIVKTLVDGKGVDREVAERDAVPIWRTLYVEDSGKWVRKEVPRTSRGFAFAQRPDE